MNMMIAPNTTHADREEHPPADRLPRSGIFESTVEAHDLLFETRIEHLEAEERVAVLRRDWTTATSKVLERVALRRLRRPITARRRI